MKPIIFKIIIFLWNLFPQKKILSKFIKNNDYLKGKLYKDLHFKGIMNCSINNLKFKIYNPGFTTIENEIFWNGLENGWEKISIKIWKNLVMDSKIILDIGANSGIYSFIASTLNPNAEIYSFEPVKRTSDIFKKNLALNKSKNINLIEKAVSYTTGKATFYDVKSISQYSASLNKEMLNDSTNIISYKIDIIALDESNLFVNKKVDLIKIDVEMHEPEAISGMIKIIKRDEPTIIIEILTTEIAEKISTILNGIKYEIYSIDELNKPKKLDSIQKSELYNILLIKNKNTKDILNL